MDKAEYNLSILLNFTTDVIASPRSLFLADVAIQSLMRGKEGIYCSLSCFTGLLRRKKAAPRNDAVQN